jgi:hypothetical protein
MVNKLKEKMQMLRINMEWLLSEKENGKK